MSRVRIADGSPKSNAYWPLLLAGVAELADALDLGSSVIDVGVQVLSPALNYNWPMPIFLIYAPVAQWIEHLTSDQGVGGSSPLGCAKSAL